MHIVTKCHELLVKTLSLLLALDIAHFQPLPKNYDHRCGSEQDRFKNESLAVFESLHFVTTER